jgi:hypothetical protein
MMPHPRKKLIFLFPFSSSLEPIVQNFSAILYVVALHGTVSAVYSLQNFQ